MPQRTLTKQITPYPAVKKGFNGARAGEVKFGEFKARKIPKSTYERPSKRKAADQLQNKKDAGDRPGATGMNESAISFFQSASESEEAVVSALTYDAIVEESKMMGRSRVVLNPFGKPTTSRNQPTYPSFRF